MLKSDLERLVRARVQDARVLLAGGQYDGCYYLAGFAVEAALKACIAKQTRRHEFPDKDRANRVFTHDLAALLRVAQLNDALAADMALQGKWTVVAKWRVDVRYEIEKSHGDAATGRGGIIPWLRRHW